MRSENRLRANSNEWQGRCRLTQPLRRAADIRMGRKRPSWSWFRPNIVCCDAKVTSDDEDVLRAGFANTLDARTTSSRAVAVPGFAMAHAPRRARPEAQILQLRRRPRRSFGRASRILRRGLRPVTSTARQEVSLSVSAKVSSTVARRLEHHARNMRQHPTPSEQVLWQAIRGGRLGVSFRRQVPVGAYIVDFLAARERLVVEVDGGYHTERGSADQRRQRWLERQGYRVVRVSAATVLQETAAAVQAIAQALSDPRDA
jgi:very-short-patch-repair endonuclease